MDFNGKHRNTIYALLITTLMVLLPSTGVAMPQHTDIKKPTRERVKKDNNADKDKKSAQNKNNDSKKADDKKKEETKKKDEAKKDDKNAPVKATVKPAAKQEETTKPAQDNKKDLKAAPPVDEKKKEEVKEQESKPAPPRPVDMNFDGIDVSKYQLNINWDEIKKNPKIQYVYIKATEGCDHTDHRYEDNIRNARKHGVKVGSYHYLTNRSSATAQFQNFVRTARKEEQDLIPFIDVEECSRWNSQQLRDSLKVFADLLEDYYGCKPLIYTSESFFNKHLGRAFKDYPLFIAKYSANAPSIGYNWIMWQYSDKGTIPGIKSNVDLSRFNKGYSLNDIIYRPGKAKSKPKGSVKDAVDRKEKPASVEMSSGKTKPAPTPSKRQQAEEKKKAEKEKKNIERNRKLAEDDAKKKAEDERRAKAKEEQINKQKERQKAREEAARKEKEAKDKRKADAQKAREQKAQNQAAKKAASKTNKKAASTLTTKMSQAQHNDSIRTAKNQGQRTNKSSADND